MYSDGWLRLGHKNGGAIEILSNVSYGNTKSLLSVDFKIWTDNRENVIGVSVGFCSISSEFFYDLPIEEWMKFLKLVLKSSNFTESQKLLSKFIKENEEDYFTFQHSLELNEIKFYKDAYYDIDDFS